MCSRQRHGTYGTVQIGKPNLVLPHSGWVGGWPSRKHGLNLIQAKSGVFSLSVGGQLGGWVFPRTISQTKFVSSQIRCYLILGEWVGMWVVRRKIFGPNFYKSKSGIISWKGGQ